MASLPGLEPDDHDLAWMITDALAAEGWDDPDDDASRGPDDVAITWNDQTREDYDTFSDYQRGTSQDDDIRAIFETNMFGGVIPEYD